MADGVLVVGSINRDLMAAASRLPLPGETVLAEQLDEHEGGKGANAAVAAARLGCSVALIGAVGDDFAGQRSREQLVAEGVDVSGIVVLNGHRTGTALVVSDGAGENQIVVAPGANREVTARQVRASVEAWSGRVRVVLVGLEIPDEAVFSAVQAAHEYGLVCMLNPAPARASVMGLVDWNPILTPNAGEARLLTGEDEPSQAAQVLASATDAPVVVTLGARGALLVETAGRELLEIASHPVTVRDTIGAGDTFNGALAARLAKGGELTSAVRYAVVAAACSVRANGARTGMPTAAEVSSEML